MCTLSSSLRLRTTDLERSIDALLTTKRNLSDNYRLRHISTEARPFCLIENELELKQKELAAVRAELQK